MSVLFAILLTCACTQTNKDIYIDDLEDESPITIYTCSRHSSLISYVKSYNIAKEDDKREVKIVHFNWDTPEEMEVMYNQIINEISTGGGPDIILIDWFTDTHLDIWKMEKSNSFADMDILIENSETFNFDDYNRMVLDAGIMNGKRVFMPTSYKVEYLIGFEESFEYNNLPIPENLDMETYISLLEEYYKTTPNQATFWISPLYLLDKYITLDESIEKTDELKRLFEVLKTENSRYQEHMDKQWYSADDWYEEYDRFYEEYYLFCRPINYDYNQYKRITSNYNMTDIIYNSDFIWFQNPAYDGVVKAYTETGFAININSKHKNEAFEFIEFAMSHGQQSAGYKLIDLPVNNETYQAEIKKLSKGYPGYFIHLFDDKEQPLPEHLQNDFIAYVESAQTCEYIGSLRYVYNNVINRTIEDYYNDVLTFDEMIDEINNKLSIYYTE